MHVLNNYIDSQINQSIYNGRCDDDEDDGLWWWW